MRDSWQDFGNRTYGHNEGGEPAHRGAQTLRFYADKFGLLILLGSGLWRGATLIRHHATDIQCQC